MAELESNKEHKSSSWFTCCSKAFPATSKGLSPEKTMVVKVKKQPGGWKSMPFIIGNETFERLAAFGLLANFMVYLQREYHLDQVAATNLIGVYAGVVNFVPLLGAFISDAYIGRFWAIAIGSFASFSDKSLLRMFRKSNQVLHILAKQNLADDPKE
ncbi:hypothetical protein Cgig2_031236 [Carnegiea gigantea]|uniref:Uncharacterized protein n=1 Tax=Carnegiea gigantea TaxID=171969 RepID=A0A9Q1QJY0_9CARY|nr:hypothetical protein Cgig2_031236 [Carnegiea gigantea]